MTVQIPRLLIAAPASGCGKTTVTCAILRALIRRGLRAVSFKSGPDYIDPMFHRESVGTAFSSNLDLFLGDADTARYWLCRNAKGADIAVIEGAMGYYDGLAGTSERASAYDLARETQTPVLLVVNCRGASRSIAAQVKGFTGFRPDANIRAVLLNQLPPMLFPALKELIEVECGIPVAGYLPPLPQLAFESRHLGLVTAAETIGLSAKLDALAQQAEATIDLELFWQIAQKAPVLTAHDPVRPRLPVRKTRIAVAQDEAFCFYYADSLTLLRDFGAELVPFSPLRDERMPDGVDGLLLGGGYPELHARALSENASMRASIRTAVASGLPTIAECGGFLYLGESLEDAEKSVWPMAGVLSARGYRTPRLQRFGYAELAAKGENLLCGAGETLTAHEFHYWDSDAPGADCTAAKPLRNRSWDCVRATATLWAGFPHLYLAGNPVAAARFLCAAADRKEGN